MSSSAHCSTTRPSCTRNMLMPRNSTAPARRGHAGHRSRVDAAPGDAVRHQVALRDLVVDLVGVAGHAVADAAHEVLEAWDGPWAAGPACAPRSRARRCRRPRRRCRGCSRWRGAPAPCFRLADAECHDRSSSFTPRLAPERRRSAATSRTGPSWPSPRPTSRARRSGR